MNLISIGDWCLKNYELLIFAGISIWSTYMFIKENKHNLLKEAIARVNEIIETSNKQYPAEEKLNMACDFFYDRYLTRFVPAWLLKIFFSKEKLRGLIQKEYNRIYKIGQNKTLEYIKKIK